MRAPVATIAAPPFPPLARWVNVKRLQMERLVGAPVLIEFWDFCRPNSIRTLPYLKAWHERYGGPLAGATAPPAATGEAEAGQGAVEGARAPVSDPGLRLHVIGVHSPGFQPSRDPNAVARAVSRLGIRYPVMIDSDLEMWRGYENLGWPARYLFDRNGMLYHYHYGEGAYEETELAIQALLGGEGPQPEPISPLRPEDAPEAQLAPQTEDQEGAYCGPYEAGGVWVVLDGSGEVRVNGGEGQGGFTMRFSAPGAYPLIEHDRHTAGVVAIETGEGLRCLATCFTPGVA